MIKAYVLHIDYSLNDAGTQGIPFTPVVYRSLTEEVIHKEDYIYINPEYIVSAYPCSVKCIDRTSPKKDPVSYAAYKIHLENEKTPLYVFSTLFDVDLQSELNK